MYRWLYTRLHQISLATIVISSLVDGQQIYAAQLPTKITVGQYQLRLATNPQSRSQGLQGVKHISKYQGMLFVYPKPTKAIYWMYGCYTGMDIIFLDINGKIQGMSSAIPPTIKNSLPEQCLRYTIRGPMSASQTRYTSLPKTTYVVEVPLGDGHNFVKTSAHLIPYAIATAKIEAN